MSKPKPGGLRGNRRCTTVGVAAAGAVLASVGGAVLLTTSGDARPQPSTSLSTSSASPRGTRPVGLGHAAVAVPRSWRTNATECGTPQVDTVIVDVGVTLDCLVRRPARVDSVEVTPGKRRFDFRADETLTIDGVAAERQATSCARSAFEHRVCNGTVYLPSMRLAFRAESSTSAAEVDRILQGVQVLRDEVGVPGYQDLFVTYQGSSARTYQSVLQSQGFTVDNRTRAVPRLDPGFVVGASPRPGSMLSPGAMVTVIASR